MGDQLPTKIYSLEEFKENGVFICLFCSEMLLSEFESTMKWVCVICYSNSIKIKLTLWD